MLDTSRAYSERFAGPTWTTQDRRGMTDDTMIFDRRAVVLRRNRAGRDLDVADSADLGRAPCDFLLARVAEDFVERLGIVQRTFPLALSLGAYHGLVANAIRGLPKIGTLVETEPAPGLLARCRGLKVQADEEALPFADETFDLVVSGLALQFVNDLPGALVQVRRALKKDGLFLAALLGGRTLSELREAWLAAEIDVDGGASPRVAPFADVRDLGGLLQRAGFALPVVDSDVVRVRYPTPLALMRDLKAMGASNPLVARRRRPVRRQTLLRAVDIYTERFGGPDGRVDATFEVITLTAWVPHPSQPQPLRPGSAKMRLADVLGSPDRPQPPGGDTSER